MSALVSTDISSDLTKRARCPRCGYSLRGAIESWHESCPLTGICSECGLAYQWAELLNDKFYRPRWNIEFVLRRRFFALALLATAVCSFVPWFFWSKLRMSHEMKWKRLAVYLLVLATIAWLMYITSNAVIVRRDWLAADQNPNHTKMTRSLEFATLYSFILPNSSKPIFSYTYNYIPLTSPTNQSAPLTIIYSSPVWVKRVWRWNNDVTFLMTCFVLALPVTFLLLPVSRRRALVRWRHIARVFAYSLLFPALVCLGIIIIAFRSYKNVVGYMYRPRLFYEELPRYLCLVAIGLLAIWWWVAIRRYLRMDEAWKVSLSVIITSFLLATVMTYLFHAEFIRSLIDQF